MKTRIPLLALGILVAADVFAGGQPITFSSVVNPTFGDLLGGTAGRTFVLSTAGTITVGAGDYVSGAAAGSVIITSGNKAIDILAANLTANGGVTITQVTCNYDNTGDADCDVGFTAQGSKNSKTMLIGLEIDTTLMHGDNDTASPTFDIVITYQ